MKISILKTLRVSVAALGLLLVGVPAWASAISGIVTGGDASGKGGTYIQLSAPWGNASSPANNVGNNNFNNWNLYEFDEVQDYTLTSALSVQVGGTAGVIPAGTVIDSQYVFFDPPGTNGGSLIGNVYYNGTVLGIVTSDAGLKASNYLGDAGITYNDPSLVGLESGDTVSVNANNADEIHWNTSASAPGDSVRVITAVATPEPSSLLLLGVALLGAAVTTKGNRLS